MFVLMLAALAALAAPAAAVLDAEDERRFEDLRVNVDLVKSLIPHAFTRVSLEPKGNSTTR